MRKKLETATISPTISSSSFQVEDIGMWTNVSPVSLEQVLTRTDSQDVSDQPKIPDKPSGFSKERTSKGRWKALVKLVVTPVPDVSKTETPKLEVYKVPVETPVLVQLNLVHKWDYWC
jgi:hypothetical protein